MSAIVGAVFLIVYQLLFGAQFMFSQVSPDGEYAIEVYTKPPLFAMPGQGGVGSRLAIVVVKDKTGAAIGASDDECSVFYGDIDISWDYERNEVDFAVARSINLKTGECSY
jgi:hypothetical protein